MYVYMYVCMYCSMSQLEEIMILWYSMKNVWLERYECMYEWTVNSRWAITFIYLWNSDQEEGRGRVWAFWEPTAPIEGISCLRYLPVMHSPTDCGRRRRVTYRALHCLAENLLHYYYDIGSTIMHYASPSWWSSLIYLEEDGDEEVFLLVLHTASIHTYLCTYMLLLLVALDTTWPYIHGHVQLGVGYVCMYVCGYDMIW